MVGLTRGGARGPLHRPRHAGNRVDSAESFTLQAGGELKNLENWTKDEVTKWLEELRKRGAFDFDVKEVACPGEFFTVLSKEDLEKIAGGIDGIHIFNAKEKLKRERPVKRERADALITAGAPSKKQNLMSDAAKFFQAGSKKTRIENHEEDAAGSARPGIPFIDLLTEEDFLKKAQKSKLGRVSSLLNKGLQPCTMVLKKPERKINAIAYFWPQGETNAKIRVDILREINAVHVKIVQKPPQKRDFQSMLKNHAMSGPRAQQYEEVLLELNNQRMDNDSDHSIFEYAVQIPSEYHTVGYMKFNSRRYIGFIFFQHEDSKIEDFDRSTKSDRINEDLDLSDFVERYPQLPF
eukprot:1384265-Amorphochlora_amoeboformis.AAC.1